MRCAVFGCISDNCSKKFDMTIKFFRFPKNEQLRKLWSFRCCRSDKINLKVARICSKHFAEDDYARNLKYELLNCEIPPTARILKTDAVPSLNLYDERNKLQPKVREDRVSRRAFKKDIDQLIKTSKSVINTQETVVPRIPQIEGPSCVVTLSNMVVPSTSTDSQTEIEKLQKKIAELEEDKKALQSLFTSRQIKKLKHPKQRIIWSLDEISTAISIYSAGPRAYRLLLKKKYPFPAVSTLKAWTKKIKIQPGILKQVLKIINKSELSTCEKICILSFDEMKIKTEYCYDRANDEILKPFKYVQVAVIRGLVKNWKQPIFFNYDCPMQKSVLFNIIQFIEDAGFYVAAITSDLGGTNRRLHNELQVDHNKPWFQINDSAHKIYVFADPPHLLKLIRNNFVDHGMIIKEKEIKKNIIEKLLAVTSTCDLSITHKISTESLNVQGPQRQKVKLAAKLFSNTIAQAINRCGTLGYFDETLHWKECADFFKLVNDWFDCLNIKLPEVDSRDRLKAFGLCLDIQEGIIDEMSDVIKNCRLIGRRCMMPFQKGIIMTNNALKLLYKDLSDTFGIQYILTYRLNQDVIENFFSCIRSKGGLHDHPNATEFRYRLRSYILGRNEGSLSEGGNVEGDISDLSSDNVSDIVLSKQCFSGLTEDAFESNLQAPIEELNEQQYDGLENLGGYICYKLNIQEENLTSNHFTWTNQLSEGGLTYPPEHLMVSLEMLEKIFGTVNDKSIVIGKNYLKNLLDLAQNVDCDEKIKRMFFRCRMYFRLRQLNHNLKMNNNSSRKRNRTLLRFS